MGTTLTLQPSDKDAYLRQDFATTNYGGATFIAIEDDTSPKRGVLEFIVSSIPSGATLISATLQLYYYYYWTTNPTGKVMWAYKVTRSDWVELQATWNRYKTNNDWTTAGGDYVTANPAGGSVAMPTAYNAWVSWDVLAIVQDAYDTAIPVELLVKFETEQLSSGQSEADFYSNNYTTNTLLRPRLVIVYSLPATRGWWSK
jgi:hypothetical protein